MITGWVYGALWLLIAAYMLYLSFRETKLLIPVSIFFLLLSAWTFADEFVKENLFEGVYGWIYRAAACIALVVCLFIIIRRKRQD